MDFKRYLYLIKQKNLKTFPEFNQQPLKILFYN